MKYKFKYVLFIIILGIFMVGSFLAFFTYKKLNETAMKACILSLESPIVNSFQQNNSELTSYLSTDWKPLNQQESRALIRRIVMSGTSDCGTIKNMSEGEDYWGNPIKVILRQSPVDGKVEAIIWSNVADGKEATEDDIRIERTR